MAGRLLPLTLAASTFALCAVAGCAHAPRSSATSWTASDVWLEPAKAYGDVVWFPGELEALEDAVAELLARPTEGGFRVRPPAELRRLFVDAAAGRLPGLTFRCEAAPPPASLAGVVYRGAARGEVEVRCGEGTCGLTVVLNVVREGGAAGEVDEIARFVADLAHDGAPSAWAAELRAHGWRRVPAPDPEGGLGLVGGVLTPGRAPGVYAIVSEVTTTGAWASRPSSEDLQPFAAELEACRGSDPAARPWRDWWSQAYLVELDEAGSVVRCEAEHVDHLVPPGFACTCDLMKKKVSFRTGAAGRRARFDLDVTRLKAGSMPASRLARTAYFQVKRSTDPSAILGTGVFRPGALAACLEPVEAPLGELSVPVDLQVAADGRARRHHVEWPPSVPKVVRTCLTRALAEAQFDCPLSGAASVGGALELSVRPVR